LRSYLRAITAPLTPSRAFDDLTRAAGFTTMQFSADPTVAVTQLCGIPTRPAGAAAVPTGRH